MPSIYHGRNLRRGRRSEPGRIYVVTAVTAGRKPLFSDLCTARAAVRGFHAESVARRASTLAHVVMPDHIHWLLRLEDASDLSEAVRAYKAQVSTRLGLPVWQRGFHDRALRRDEDVKAVARYIIANPIRAGLADSVMHHSHWDAVWVDGADSAL